MKKLKLALSTSAALFLIPLAHAGDANINITKSNHYSINIKQVSSHNKKNETATIKIENALGTSSETVDIVVEQDSGSEKADAKIEISGTGAGSSATIKQHLDGDSDGYTRASINIHAGSGKSNKATILQNRNSDATASITIEENEADGTGGEAYNNTAKISQVQAGAIVVGTAPEITAATLRMTNSWRSDADIYQTATMGSFATNQISASESISSEIVQIGGIKDYAVLLVKNSSDSGFSIKQEGGGNSSSVWIEAENASSLSATVKQTLFERNRASLTFNDVSDSSFKLEQDGGSEADLIIRNDNKTFAFIEQSGGVAIKLNTTDTSNGFINVEQGTLPAGFEINF